MISAWQDQDFEGVAKLFDELWGWELEGSEQEKRDISDCWKKKKQKVFMPSVFKKIKRAARFLV